MPKVSEIKHPLGIHANDRNVTISFSTSSSNWNGFARDYNFPNDPSKLVWYFDGTAANAKTPLSSAEISRYNELLATFKQVLDTSGASTPASSLVVYKADLLGNTKTPSISPKGAAWTYQKQTSGTTVTELETVFDKTLNFSMPSGIFYVLHEIGRVFGLYEPNSNLADPNYNVNMTVMSNRVIDGRYPVTPMPYDVAALEQIYGSSTTFLSGPTPYKYAANGSAYFTGNKLSHTVVDANTAASNIDTFDLSAYTLSGGATIDLREAIDANDNWVDAPTIVGDEYVYIARGTVIENAIGTKNDDLITGNDAKNELQAGDGSDQLYGGANDDTLVGGADS